MKKLALIFLMFSSSVLYPNEKNPVSQNILLTTQEIRYVSPYASKVYIVWGINNWNIPQASSIKEGSFIKDKLVYTPMKKTSYGFTSEITVPFNTVIDFDFRITQGPAERPVDIWDVNTSPAKDYHSLVNNNKTILLKSTIIATPKEALSILDFALAILIITILCYLLLIFFIRIIKNMSTKPEPFTIIISSALVLAVQLILLRSSVTSLSWDLYLNPFSSLLKVLWAGFYDVIYVAILTGFFLLLFVIFRTRKSRSIITFLFIGFALLSLIGGIMNIRVVETIGRPFDYSWLYYSDFLKSADARAAMSSNITTGYIFKICMICFSAFFSGLILSILTDLIIKKTRMKFVASSSLLLATLSYLILAPGAIKFYHWDYEKLANPVIAFTGSLGPFSSDPGLFTMNIDDSLKLEFSQNNYLPSVPKKNKTIKNIILFVMESTPAEYIAPYSQKFKITPELEKYISESIVFDNVYAHAPSTNNSLVSILGSIYPWLSYNSLTKEHPDIKIPTLSSELKKSGYRTAFFNSADNRFQKANEFLANRKFDEIMDCSALKCSADYTFKDEKQNFLNGTDDECTGEELSNWIRQKSDKPFFAMMWTYQTHYPYFFSGEEENYTSSYPELNRYLNAVHHSDLVLGKILSELKQSGLDESTLVVVVGDHGEAFGRHNQVAHASGIYEENLHVPCIFINPAFKGDHWAAIGGLIDLAPTIMDQLGQAPAASWKGKDLFNEKENGRVYFFTPWADYLFGYREGNKKFIFNATKNLTEIYDLKNDPLETKNLAADFPDIANTCHQRLAGWVQSNNKYIGSLLGTH